MNIDQLHNYQIFSANHIITNNHCCLFLDMGLGKTVSTLTAINLLINDYVEISNALIVAPKRVAESVWSDEIEKMGPLEELDIFQNNRQCKQARRSIK